SGLDPDADDDDAPGLRVDISGRRAVFDLTLVVRFGHLVPAVAAAVRSAVIESVEQTFGLDVVEVNIVVDDVYVDDSFPADTGRAVVKEATRDLMNDGFGLDALGPGESAAIFDALRAVRLAAGDFQT